MSKANLSALLAKFSEIMEVDLSLGPDDFTVVQVDERLDLEISFDEDSQTLMLVAACGALPEEPEVLQELLLEVLDANFHWAGSGGGTLATNSDAGKLYLQLREATHQLDEDRLQNLLNAIVHNATLWADRLEKGTWAGISQRPGVGDDVADGDAADEPSDSAPSMPDRPPAGMIRV